MIISIIAAIAKNRVIGSKNKLPWHLPEDIKRFRTLTLGKPVIMGRKTYESIGKPLPDRKNIVLTRNKDYHISGCIVVHSLDEALNTAKGNNEVMIIGGAEIYKMFLPLADKMYLTLIDAEFAGDSYFPRYNPSEWQEIEHIKKRTENISYTFSTLIRENTRQKTNPPQLIGASLKKLKRI